MTSIRVQEGTMRRMMFKRSDTWIQTNKYKIDRMFLSIFTFCSIVEILCYIEVLLYTFRLKINESNTFRINILGLIINLIVFRFCFN